MRRAAVALCGVLLLPARPAEAVAHEIPARVGIIAFVRPEGGTLRVVARIPLEAMRDLDVRERPDGTLDVAQLSVLLPDAVRLWVADYLRLDEDGRVLTAAPTIRTRLSLGSDRAFATFEAARAHVLGPGAPAGTEFRWRQAMLDLIIEYPIRDARAHFTIEPSLAHLGVRTTTVLRFLPPDSPERVYEYIGNPGRVALDPRWTEAARRFVTLGIEHILGGIDHLLFVLCLVIPIRRWRRLVEIVTAFTLAHSVTLVGATLGIAPSGLWFPPFVEVLIALSIVYMALENILVPAERLQYRWRVAFGFGLVHGFGFSFALRESLQFAGAHVATSLAAFNLGVEIGQIGVLAVAVPMLGWLFARLPNARAGVIVLSALVAHQAWHWMVERGGQLAGYRVEWPTLDATFALAAVRGALLLCVAVAVALGFHVATGRLAKPRG